MTCRDGGIVSSKYGFRDAADRGHVATETDLIVLVRDGGAAAGDRFEFVLRVGETFEAFFPDRVEDGDLGAAERCATEISKHARVIGSGILADDEDGVSLLEVFEQDGAFSNA